MKSFSMLIKPASSSCNMKCTYCFYHDVSSHRNAYANQIMSLTVMKTLIDKTLDTFLDDVTIHFAFQGGEPTCAGLEYFKSFTSYVEHKKKTHHSIQYSIQTNGVLINEEWCSLFQEHKFLVGVSLDGFEENHNMHRLNINQEGNFQTVMQAIDLLKQYSIQFNILTVLTNHLSYHAKELFAFYQKKHFEYIQLIPCLASLNENYSEHSLTPERFNAFYQEFFDVWYEAYQYGKRMNISLFDNIIPMFIGLPPYQCGFIGLCFMQFVVESDGSIYPCDFYALDQYKVGNIMKNSIIELMTSSVVKQFKEEPRMYCKECKTCKYHIICNGQCKRMQDCYYDETYCGYKAFIESKEEKLILIAKQIKKA